MNNGINMVTIDQYMEEVKAEKISLNVSIQRGDDKWTPAQKSKLIETVLKGYPVPTIYTADFAGRQIVYDGLQRTTALKKFINNEFALKNVDAAWCDKTFSELDEEDKEKILMRELSFMHAGEVSAEELSELFLNLNNGTPLTKVQKSRGILGNSVAEWTKEMCSHALFTDMAQFTPRQIKDDAALECLLQGILLIHGCLGNSNGDRYEWKSISRDEVQKYSEEILSKTSKEELEKYEKVIEYIDSSQYKNQFDKTFIPIVVVLGRYAMDSNISQKDFHTYLQKIVLKRPDGYDEYLGSGNVFKAKTVGRLKTVVENFKQYFPDAVTPEINLDTSTKKASSKKTKKGISNEKDVPLKADNGATASENSSVSEDNAEPVKSAQVEEATPADSNSSEPSADTVVEAAEDSADDVVSVSSETDTDVNSDASIRAEEDVADTASEGTSDRLLQKMQVVCEE